MVEQAIPQEDGTVIRRVFPGEGQPPIETEFDTDEMLLIARAEEQRAERWQKVKHPLRFIREKVIGALDTSIEAQTEQLTSDTGNADEAFLHNTVDGWRDERGGDHA